MTSPAARRLLTLATAAVALLLLYKILARPAPAPSPAPAAGGRCAPQHRVAFLKTHKAASSSVQNILMRYSRDHGLNLVLPSAGNYLGRYVPFSRAM